MLTLFEKWALGDKTTVLHFRFDFHSALEAVYDVSSGQLPHTLRFLNMSRSLFATVC